MSNFIIIKYKKWIKASGCYPYRIVLIAVVKDGNTDIKDHTKNCHTYATEYTTHQQIDATKDGNQIYIASGHYFQDITEALKDFEDRD